MTACLNDLRYIPLNNEQNEPTQGDIGKTSNKPNQAKRNEFEELYASANEELYLGCDYVTRLDFMAKFTYFKGDDNKDVHFCPVCNTSRWKDSNTPEKKVPKKVLRYFPIIPRLQCLYKSSHTAKEITWHATGKCTDPGRMQHPVDGRAWKNFDTKYPDFTKEPGNVRLGLAADDFNPFSNLSKTAYVSHRRFLKKPHKWRRSLEFNGETEDGDPPREFNWDQIQAQLARLATRMKGKLPSYEGVKIKRNVLVELNWTKRFIFYELEYWSFLTLKHNLDIMHIETNVLESMLNTLLMNDKSKDTAKARQDLKRLGIRSGLWLGLKSHDCHIMMQHLLPYGLQQYLPDTFAKLIIELCSFFKQICCATLMKDYMLKAQSKVVDILCNLELIYPPACFDIMIYLVIHLPLEALEGGPIRPRWIRSIDFQSSTLKIWPDDHPTRSSSDLTLSTSLNDLDFVTLHIDGQSTDVDAPSDIIDVNKDDDIIDDEDAFPHDLADSNDEDLVNVDDDDDVVMSANVARGDGGDDRPLSHQIPTGCGGCLGNRGKGTRKPNLGGKKAGRLHTRQETRKLRLKKITDGAHKGVADALPFLAPGPGGADGEGPGKDWTQFDLKPHMESERWPKIYTGIQQHLQKIYNGNKSALKAQHWVQNPETGTYDVESIRRGRPANISAADWDAQIAFWNDPKNLARCAQNRKNQAKSTVSSATQEYSSLIQTFFDTHTVGGVFLRDEDRCLYGLGTYTDDQIMAMVCEGKQRRHILGVAQKSNKQLQKQIDMITKAMSSDDRYSQLFTQLQSQHERGVARARMMSRAMMRTPARMRIVRRCYIWVNIDLYLADNASFVARKPVCSSIVVMNKFDHNEMVRAIDKYGVSHFPVVPPLLNALIRTGKSVYSGKLKSLKQVSCGAAPLSTKRIEEFVQTFPHIDFIQVRN
ncbi:zinc finger, PHD-type containing protein [Tanacetum coccineum]